jgi:hypothetical protein
MVPPDPEDRRLADADPLGDRPARPVGLALGRTTEGDADDPGHHPLVVGPWTSASRSVLLQAGHAGLLEAPAPKQHGGNGAVELLGDRRVGDPLGRTEDDPGAQDLTLGQRAAARPCGQGSAAVLVEVERGSGTIGHAGIILAPPLKCQAICGP